MVLAENTPKLQDTLKAQQGPLNIASQLNNLHQTRDYPRWYYEDVP